VTDHVSQATNELNQKIDAVNTSLNGILSQMHFLVNDVNKLRGGEGTSTSRFSRLGKLEFPKFHGNDVKGWMFRVKQFFAIDNVNEEDKIKMVSIHLYDKALAWNLQFVKAHGGTVMWNVYEESILKRFGAVNEDPMAQLKNLSMLIAGLPATMEMNVRMFRPQTLVDAFSLANFQEASLAVIKQKTTPLLPTPKFNNNYYANKNVNYPNKATTVTTPVPNTQVVTKYPALPSPAPRCNTLKSEYAAEC
ncbi:hypothetical protein Tco_1280263, partial [Tanacetum coccineum]